MAGSRRQFLGSALAGAGGIAIAQAAQAQAAAVPQPTGAAAAPRNLSYATIKSGDTLGLGLKVPGGVLDVRAAEASRATGAPTTLAAVIRREGNVAALAQLVARSGSDLSRFVVAENDIRFGPLVAEAPKVLCIGLNYRAHVAEAQQQIPTTPIFFNKFNSSLNGHGGTIRVSSENAKAFDYEAEMVVVLARGGRNIAEAAALDHVLGYAVGQDFSARDLQMATSQWMMGKAGDGWGPVGPWLVGAELVDPHNLNIECKVNGEVRQSSNTSRMIFNVAAQIAYLSKHMTLSPGDVIFTGTPEGVIVGYPKEKQVWLKAGDRITTTIEKLGTQEIVLT
ncbi:MAG: fumarylacetoacetate hydrolase family protein [Rhizobacter sp.]|nr:fumarylacetoacetate hydrolase family protein [Rhizobacter sp.]